MANRRLSDLFNRFIAKKTPPSESEELMGLIAAEENEEQVKGLFKASWDNFNASTPPFSNERSKKILQRLLQRIEPAKTRSLWPTIAAAASILLFLSFGTYFILQRQALQHTKENAAAIKPGQNKAILTLGNGSQIVLSGTSNGKIAVQGNIIINKTVGGQVVYTVADGTPLVSEFNTITTPRGGQYRLTLSDGTNVWLNAASSIKYPTTFTGKDRLVELTGEAYFEVAHNKAMPFRVKTATQIVEVLGTHFNINAYGDESFTKTTLLEGSVKVTHNNEEKILVPGEQSSLNSNSFNVAKANVEEVVAWKNGYFRFSNASLPVILRQFSRWYDITVVYDQSMNDQYFNGKITRSADLSRVLQILEKGGVRYKVDGRQLTIIDDK